MAKETAQLSREAQELEEYFARKAQRQAPAWMPEPGTTIKAEVIGLRMGQSEYGAYPIVIYRQESGDVVAVHAFHTTLRETLQELGTTIGKWQYVSYDGKRASRTRKDSNGEPVQYHLYDVENVGEDSAIQGVDENFSF